MNAAHLERLPDWQGRLTRYLATAARTRFMPGSFDCALFAAGAVEAQTGVDPASRWRGRYADLGEGLALLAGEGHADHLALCSSLLPEVEPARARPGDIVALPAGGNFPSLGVVQGAMAYVPVEGGTGFILLPMTLAIRAWAVGP